MELVEGAGLDTGCERPVFPLSYGLQRLSHVFQLPAHVAACPSTPTLTAGDWSGLTAFCAKHIRRGIPFSQSPDEKALEILSRTVFKSHCKSIQHMPFGMLERDDELAKRLMIQAHSCQL